MPQDMATSGLDILCPPRPSEPARAALAWRPTMQEIAAAVVLLCIAVLGPTLGALLQRQERAAVLPATARTARLILDQAALQLHGAMPGDLESALARMARYSAADRLTLWSADGRIVAEYAGRRDIPPIPFPAPQSGQMVDGSALTLWQRIEPSGELAAVRLDMASALDAADLHARQITLLAALTGLVITAILYRALASQSALIRRLIRTAEAAPRDGRIALSKLPRWAANEIALFARALERTRQEHSLARKERVRLEKLIRGATAGSTEALIVHDLDGRILAVNAAAEQLTQLPAAALHATRIQELLDDAGSHGVDLTLALLRSGKSPVTHGQTVDRKIVAHDGTRVPVSCVFRLLEIGERRVVTLHCHDRRSEFERTRRMEEALSEARAATQTMTQFLAMVTHEIRTPLNGLLGLVDLLSSTPLKPEQKEWTEGMRASLRLLRTLLNDLLDLSKVRAGKLQLEEIPFDLHEQLENCLRGHRAVAQERSVDLRLLVDTPERMLFGDPYRIAQVTGNLVDNALKFTARGSVTVQVTVKRRGDALSPDRTLTIAVADTGIGIPPDRIDLLFQPFSQASQSIARQYGGTGLGLALCRQLCEAMNGSLSVRSEEGRGSTFVAVLQCKVPQDQSPFVDTLPQEDVDLSLLRGRRVLVADDNRINQTLLQRWLEQSGMVVHCVNNGDQAVQSVCTQHYDIVLMDMLMPVMNGLDAARAIRALGRSAAAGSAKFSKLPIIAVTASAVSGDRDECAAAGMDYYISKPIERHVLLRTIERALTARSAKAAPASTPHFSPSAASVWRHRAVPSAPPVVPPGARGLID